MARESIDNSLTDLSFDFLDGDPCAKDECASAKAEAAPDEAPDAEEGTVPAAETGATDQRTLVVRPSRAPRRRLGNALDLLRTLLIGLVVFAVGSLVFTMVMNPDLTFAQAVSLLAEQIASLFAWARR